MTIKQFEYKPLSHYSYAIVSNGKMAVIDPERNPECYYAFAKKMDAEIIAVIETHPHADFVSSHFQIHKETGAIIYNSKKLEADYKHQSFDDNDRIQLGSITLEAINTPGHSPDSITIVAREGDDTALFTGDTLFIGDVGRPDLRENTETMLAERYELAAMMYTTMQTKFNNLPDDALVYPAHGAGSLCGKNLSDAASSTLGNERIGNWAFKKQSKEEFIKILLDRQPFIPLYFPFDVAMNKAGAENLKVAIDSIPFQEDATATGLIVDIRNAESFKNGYLKGSFNIQAVSDNAKFETWLGAIVAPNEEFTLIIDTAINKEKFLYRVAKIGYEKQLIKVITLSNKSTETSPILDVSDFKNHPDQYTIIDVRTISEIDVKTFFRNAIPHPLHELRTTAATIPRDKPIVVHCAGGYRSAAASSILQKEIAGVAIYDLGNAIKDF